jgi:crossover junction endodeoxyribonuclease RusA
VSDSKLETIIIELPFPDSKLNPNRSNGYHWTESRKQRDIAKQIGYTQARVALDCKEFVPAEQYALWITFYPPDRRHRDADNLHASMKHYLDGICQALGINDRSFREVTLAFGEVHKPGAVTVEIIRQALEINENSDIR